MNEITLVSRRNGVNTQKAVEHLRNGIVPTNHPFFYHEIYHVVPNKHSEIGLSTLRMRFRIEPKQGKEKEWDTADAFIYLGNVLTAFRNATQCLKLVVNYDTMHEATFKKKTISFLIEYRVDVKERSTF